MSKHQYLEKTGTQKRTRGTWEMGGEDVLQPKGAWKY